MSALVQANDRTVLGLKVPGLAPWNQSQLGRIPRDFNDLTFPGFELLLQKIGKAHMPNKAKSLRIALGRGDQSCFGSKASHLRLLESADGE